MKRLMILTAAFALACGASAATMTSAATCPSRVRQRDSTASAARPDTVRTTNERMILFIFIVYHFPNFNSTNEDGA